MSSPFLLSGRNEICIFAAKKNKNRMYHDKVLSHLDGCTFTCLHGLRQGEKGDGGRRNGKYGAAYRDK